MDKTELFRKEKCDRDLIPDFEEQQGQKASFPAYS